MSNASTTINPDNHLLLGQPLLRVPHELLRKTFKTSHKYVKHETTNFLSSVKEVANAAGQGASAEQSLEQLDSMIGRMQGLKRKLEALREEEKALHQQSRKRINHLDELYKVQSLADDRYSAWSTVQLNRLLVDYMVRRGYGQSARELAVETGIDDLVDIDIFLQCSKIVASLRNCSITECLAWCSENKDTLKKSNSNLEFELRLQQYIEMVRVGNIPGAISYMKKHMSQAPSSDVQKAAALLVFPPSTIFEPYKTLFSTERWEYLAQTFITTHHSIFSLPPRALLQITLVAGLSSLKTPTCHSSDQRRNNTASGTSLCPICSTELNDLARDVPYAHHVRSSVEPDPVVLPNGRIYGRKRLQVLSAKVGVRDGRVRDPLTGEEFNESAISKVFIT